MQSTRNEGPTLAGSQVPLLNQEQLQPGVLLTGLAARHVWELLGVEGANATMQRLPRTVIVPCCTAHAYVNNSTGRGRLCTNCGHRVQALSDLLPSVAGKAKFHIISSTHGVRYTPAEYTVYAWITREGVLKTVTIKADPDGHHQWSEALPIVPELHKVWTLPEALRTMPTMSGPPSVVEED